jgi:hypothetical protein
LTSMIEATTAYQSQPWSPLSNRQQSPTAILAALVAMVGGVDFIRCNHTSSFRSHFSRQTAKVL